MGGEPVSAAWDRVRRYPVWEVARALGRETGALRRQLVRVGWAIQDLPFPRSPWSVPEQIMAAHFPEVKKKLDELRDRGIRLTERGKTAAANKGKKSTKSKTPYRRNRGPGKPQRKGRGVPEVET
jgi:hypothetical protein